MLSVFFLNGSIQYSLGKIKFEVGNDGFFVEQPKETRDLETLLTSQHVSSLRLSLLAFSHHYHYPPRPPPAI